MSESTEEKLAARLQYMKEGWLRGVDYLIGACESPIEKLFVVQYIGSGSYEGWVVPGAVPETEPIASWACNFVGGEPFRVIPQYPVRVGGQSYRLDCAMLCRGAKVAVELDGHDFHEKTKEQARKDKSRDRAVTAAGWTVLRFTGQEIYENARSCAHQVGNILWDIAMKGAK